MTKSSQPEKVRLCKAIAMVEQALNMVVCADDLYYSQANLTRGIKQLRKAKQILQRRQKRLEREEKSNG